MLRNSAVPESLNLNPTAVPPALAAHVKVKVEPDDENKRGIRTWSYRLFNDEPSDSPQFITSFVLEVAAPVTVTGTPEGWTVVTDGESNVLWYCVEQQPPYSNDIAPGTSLAGFQIQTSEHKSKHAPFGLAAWNHNANHAGAVVLDSVRSPSRKAKD
jgi:hypothetical protein